ncbi:unnamed protein product [Sphagnum jensenii]|uniref:Vesicle-fusing ATPase n=1 Tax=Sphagnum jensenii TaxID=128206 RepID=A0ABP1BJY7_9BRYO
MSDAMELFREIPLRRGDRMGVPIVETVLPNEQERLQILSIHSDNMRENSLLCAEELRLEELASRTKNFNRAELEALVKSAKQFAAIRSWYICSKCIKVTMNDFLEALDKVKPAFDDAISALELFSSTPCKDTHSVPASQTTWDTGLWRATCTCASDCQNFCGAIEGKWENYSAHMPPGRASWQVSAGNMIDLSEYGKCALITKVFDDACKSPQSVIILDDIERLLGYLHIESFSTMVLETIIHLLQRTPPQGSKLLVIGTSSITVKDLKLMKLLDAFNVHLNVPTLSPTDMRQVLEPLDVFDSADINNAITALDAEIPIKRLLMMINMAQHGGKAAHVSKGHQKIQLSYFYKCLEMTNTFSNIS